MCHCGSKAKVKVKSSGWPHTASQPGCVSDDAAPALERLAAALRSIGDTLREDAKRCQARADACAAAHIDAAIGDLGAAP